MNHTCPVCNTSLIEEEVFNPIKGEKDFLCRKENHFFGKRMVDDTVLSIKIRLKEGVETFFLRIDYDLNQTTSLWTKAGDVRPIKIPGVLLSDFSDVNKIKQKIKTCLLFS